MIKTNSFLTWIGYLLFLFTHMHRVRVIFDKTGDGFFDCFVYES